MNIEIASMLVPIIIFSLFLMTGSLFLLVKHDKSFTKLILVPSALAFAVVIILFFANLLGRAVPLPLPDKFMYLAHRVVVEGDNNKKIEVWIAENKSTRLYSIPYKREHEQMFELAGRARQNGAEVRVQKQPKGSVDSSEELGAQILLPEDIMPKR